MVFFFFGIHLSAPWGAEPYVALIQIKLNVVIDELCNNPYAKKLDLFIQRTVVEHNKMGLSTEGL